MYDYCIFEINAISRAILVNEVDMQLMISHSTTNIALKEKSWPAVNRDLNKKGNIIFEV